MHLPRKIRRRIFFSALAAAIAAGLSVALLWAASHLSPSGYSPCVLAGEPRRAAGEDFHTAVLDLLGAAGEVGSLPPDGRRGPERRRIEFSEDRINRWLGAMEDEAVAALAQVGLAQPAVRLEAGSLRVYALWRARGMVISLRLRPVFDDEGRCRVEIESASLGAVKIPRQWLQARRAELLRRMGDRLAAMTPRGGRRLGPLDAEDAAEALKLLLEAARGRRSALNFPPSCGLAAVTAIELHPGRLALTVTSRLDDVEGR